MPRIDTVRKLRVARRVLHVRERDHGLVERRLVLVEVLDEGLDPALVLEDVLLLALRIALVDGLEVGATPLLEVQERCP